MPTKRKDIVLIYFKMYSLLHIVKLAIIQKIRKRNVLLNHTFIRFTMSNTSTQQMFPLPIVESTIDNTCNCTYYFLCIKLKYMIYRIYFCIYEQCAWNNQRLYIYATIIIFLKMK